MNGRNNEKRTYHSARPAATGSNIVRLPSLMDRASRILDDGDAGELQHFIYSVMQMGYVACFTATSDRGAVAITVFDGATRYKSYARSENELLLCYRDLLSAIAGEE